MTILFAGGCLRGRILRFHGLQQFRSDGLCEIGWPLGFKLSQTPGTGPGKFAACIACSVFSMVLSGFLLWLAQRNIPIGTAYAVWTGIGALGTFLVGILWFGDSSNIWRMLAASFLLIGIIGLKLAPGH